MSSSEGLDLTSLAPPQTLTQPSSSHDLPAAPLPDSGDLPEGQNQDSGTLMDPDPNPNPNPKGGGVLSKDERFSVGNKDGVDIGIDDNDARRSDQKEVCNPGDEDVPADAGIGGVVEIAENIGGMDENGRNQVNGMHMMPFDVNQDFKSVDVNVNVNVNVNEGGSMVADVEASKEIAVVEVEVVGESSASLPCAVENNVTMEDENRVVDARVEREGFDYLEASKEIVVEEVEVVGEASASLPCAVENNVAMEDENRVVDACVEREGFDCLGDQKLGGHVVESNVSLSDERGEKQIGGSCDCENEVSVNVDKGTSLDGDGENIAGSHVAEDGVSVLGENRMISTPAMDMDASLDRGEGKFVESCASEIGAAVLGKSTPAGNFGASVVVDEQKIAGSDLSEMGLPKLCDNQIASNPVVESETSGEKNARSDITELGVSVTSNLQMMVSAAEHLETHLETDGKKLAEMNDPEGGISLLSENQMTGSRAVGLGVPLPMDENLNSEVKNTMEDISRPDDADGNGSEGEEMETSGRDKGKETNEELTLKEENTESEVEAGYDETLKTEDVAAVKLPVTEEKQNIGPMSPTTASIRNEYQASYSLPLEKKGQFSVSDLIWGKVRSHPWWPGQIFDPSDSSDLAIKYKKKGAFLVAYFGDQTFAWCEDSQLKPFCTQFPRMEKQSTTEAFLNAVNCALDEVSRRVQLGLTCSCTPEEVSARIKNQRIDNAGIREGASGARGADMSLFEPVRLLEYIKELALLPLNGGERLELVIAKAQLMSFYSSKGYLELPAFHVHGGLVENDTDFLPGGELPKDTSEFATPISISEDKTPPSLHSGEEKAKGRRRSSHKRNQISEDSLRHTRKQKSLAELMSGKKASNIVSGGKSSTDGKATGNSGTSPSGKKRKAVDSFPDDSVQKRIKRLSSLSDTDPEDPSAKKTFVVGDCICRVAGKLTGSPPILKFSGERFQNNAVKVDSERNRAVHVGGFSHSPKEKQKRKIGIPKEYSSPDELLSQLCLAARDPMKGYSFLSAVVSFFTDFRNSIHLKHSSSGKKNGSGKSGRARSSNSKTSSVELSELDEMNDSYWTDRIIQGSSEEEPSQKSRKRKGEPQSESPRKRGRPRKQSSSLQSSLKLDSNLKQQVNEDMDGEEECSKLEPKVNDDMNGESQLQRPKKRGRPRKQSNSLQSSPKLDSNLKQQVNEAMDGEEDCSPTALILFFNAADSVPSVTDLSQIFSRYGPLKESDIMRKSNHAKVVFSKRSDAEVAFSSAGKFSIFGPALVSYQLKYLSPKPKASLRASRHSKEDETSAERSNLVSPQLGKDDTRQTRDSSEVPGNETSAERNNLVSPQPGNDDAGQTRDGSAIAQVFPKTHHCFCKWDILYKAPKQLANVERSHPTFQGEFQKCVNLTETVHEFESCWKSLIDKFGLKKNQWLRSLYSARQKWAPVYLQDTFIAQISTTQQSESTNSYFDGYVFSNTSMQDFVVQYERALASRYEMELEEDIRTTHTKPSLKTTLPIEKQAANTYTRTVFLKFQEEVFESLGYVANKVKEEEAVSTYEVTTFEEHERLRTVMFNASERRASCSCLMFEFSGVLCRHALIVFTLSNFMTLPSYYILERWTRNAKSVVGLDKRGVAMQANCRKSPTLRHSFLCKQAIRCAEVGATSVQDYDVAMRALREAWEKIVASKNKGVGVGQLDTQVSGSLQGPSSNAHIEMHNITNRMTLGNLQQPKKRGRPRKSTSKPDAEKAVKNMKKCAICKEHGHDDSNCPRLRPIGGSFGTGGGMILMDTGPSELHGHGGLGGEQLGFSEGILGLSLGDRFDSHVTSGIPNFGPNNFFQISLANSRLFNVNEEFSLTGARPSGP